MKKKILQVAMLATVLAGCQMNSSVVKADAHVEPKTVYFGSYVQNLVTNQAEKEILSEQDFQNGRASVQGISFAQKGWNYYKEDAIEWRILYDDGECYTLISEKVLDKLTFSSGVGWPESGIRAWLNDTFYHSAFSEKEQEDIVEVRLNNVCLDEGYAKTEKVTNDKVWLLDEYDILYEKYGFSMSNTASDTRIAYATQYLNEDESAWNWYLRGEPYWFNYLSYVGKYVESTGALHQQGTVWDGTAGGNYEQGVRPVIKVSKNAEGLSFTKPEERQLVVPNMEIDTSTKSILGYSFSDVMSSISSFSLYKKTISDTDIIIPGLIQTNQSTETEMDSCDTMVPQGVCVSDKYILISACDEIDEIMKYHAKYKYKHDKHDSVIYVMDKNTKKYLTTIILNGNKSHVGAITWNRKKGTEGAIYIADSKSCTIWKLHLDEIDERVKNWRDASRVDLQKGFKVDISPSFLTYHGGFIYVGQFSKSEANSYMVRYKESNMRKDESGVRISLPPKTQGVAFVYGNDAQEYLIASCSSGRGNHSALKIFRANNNDRFITRFRNPMRSIDLPNMSEDIAILNDHLYIAYESAARRYYLGLDNKGASKNPIDRILVSDVGKILNVTRNNFTILPNRYSVEAVSQSGDIEEQELELLSSGYCGDSAQYSLYSDGTLNISGSGKVKEYSSNDAPWKAYEDKITNICISADISEIGDRAFYCLNNLETVSFSDFLDTEMTFKIGEYAFANCPGLIRADMPNVKFDISDTAFLGAGSSFGIYSDSDSVQVYCSEQSLFNHVHSYEFTENVQATCGDYGYDVYKCICGDEILENHVSPTENHNYELLSHEDSTCQINGKDEYQCSICGAYYENDLKMLDHTWNKGVITKYATDRAEGIRSYTCTVCGEIRNETIPKLSGNSISNTGGVTGSSKRPNSGGSSVAEKVKKPGRVKKLSLQNWSTTKSGSLWARWDFQFDADGYQIQYAKNRKFTKGRKTKNRKGGRIGIRIKKLKEGQTYYVRVRAYKKSSGKKLYGKWSKVKKIKLKYKWSVLR